MANSVDPDQTAPLIWVYSLLRPVCLKIDEHYVDWQAHNSFMEQLETIPKPKKKKKKIMTKENLTALTLQGFKLPDQHN